VITVYGSPYDETKIEFLTELHRVCGDWLGPTLIGGDFNLVRCHEEKSNGIDSWSLIEIKDPIMVFSWSNNQRIPIMAALDRVFVTTELDTKYPLATVKMLPKGISDHNPMLIDLGGVCQDRDYLFRFEKWWLEMEDFFRSS
jgi:endonuclease/exonuclease/phosphatase family metal-dependent hydrolase